MYKTNILDNYIDMVDQLNNKSIIDDIIRSTIPKRKILYESDDEEIVSTGDNKENVNIEIDDETEIIFMEEDSPFQYKTVKKTLIEELETENEEMTNEIDKEKEIIENELKDLKKKQLEELKRKQLEELEKQKLENEELERKELEKKELEKLEKEKKQLITNRDYLNHINKINSYNTNNRLKLFIINTLKNVERRLDQNDQLKTNILMTNQFDLCKKLILYFEYSQSNNNLIELNKKLKPYKLVI